MHTLSSGTRPNVWDCLTADQINAAGDDADLIALEDIFGLEVWRDNTRTTQNAPLARCEKLQEHNIKQWITMPFGTEDQHGRSLCCKFLIGNQVLAEDNLRPQETAQNVRFSRLDICTSFGLPRIAIEEMSYRHPWYMEFAPISAMSCPSRTLVSTDICTGFGTSGFSYSQCVNNKGNTQCAVLVFFRTVQQDIRDKVLSDFKNLEHLSDETTFITYLVLHLFVRLNNKILVYNNSQGASADLNIHRHANVQISDSMFGYAHGQAAQISWMEDDIRIALDVAHQYNNSSGQRPPAISDHRWARMQIQQSELHEGFRFLIQKLKMLQLDAQRRRDQISRQLGTFQNMIARELQEAGLEIAKASKLIAEETKKDGISMKTLAIVAMLYLPASTVATVFDMPVFSWTSEAGLEVDSQIWIFVVIALSLTGFTVALWWLWQRRIFRKRSASVREKDILP